MSDQRRPLAYLYAMPDDAVPYVLRRPIDQPEGDAVSENAEPRHTPGPWEAGWGELTPYPQDAGRGAYLTIKGHDGLHLATVFEINPRSPVTSDLRDGTLIAAAPDLLAACKAARQELTNPGQWANAVGILDAALYKATGDERYK